MIYQLPTWAETILVVCVAVMLAGLAAWIMCKAVMEAIEASARLEIKRRESETKALDNWKSAYEAEHAEHINDIADLNNEILALKRDIELKNAILRKAKVFDL